jgi:hypothetical protein
MADISAIADAIFNSDLGSPAARSCIRNTIHGPSLESVEARLGGHMEFHVLDLVSIGVLLPGISLAASLVRTSHAAICKSTVGF